MSHEGDRKVTGEAGPGTTPRPAGWFNRVIWRGPQLAEARATSYRPGQPGFDFYDIARQMRDRAARAANGSDGGCATIALDCLAVELLLRAHLARAGVSIGAAPLSPGDWENAATVPAIAQAWRELSPEHLAALKALAGAERVVALTNLSKAGAREVAQALHALAQRLAEPLDLDANRLGWAMFSRYLRLVAVGVAAVLVLGFTAVYLHRRAHPNLAYHCSVVASSSNAWAPDPNRLVDGIVEVMGLHTNGGEQQWVVLDLGAVKRFDEIVVYNRPDCCEERAVPLRVEVSGDNQSYSLIAERLESFDKWTVRGLHTAGRYVRLSNTPPNFLHLAEVEIY